MGKLSGVLKALKTRKAYHGSPHDFDKFSTKAIGTGEGAQAYGHGMYFSDSKDIAKWYRDSLSDPGEFGRIDGEPIYDVYKRLEDQSARLPVGPELDATYERMNFLEDLSLTRDFDDSVARIDSPEIARWAQEELRPKYEAPGKIYTVEIPHESLMLDWDKPLSEQPESVREAVDVLLADDDVYKAWKENGAMDAGAINGRQAYLRIADQKRNYTLAKVESINGRLKQLSAVMDEHSGPGYRDFKDDIGRQAAAEYDALMDEKGALNNVTSLESMQAMASDELREFNIPGITYKGNTSDVRNFVVR